MRSRNDDDVRRRAAIVAELLDEERTRARPNDHVSPLDVVDAVRAGVEDGDAVVLDNGAYKIWFARHWRASQPQTLLMDNALATMGAGLATGIAAALHDADRRTIVVTGDGGFLMNVQDLATVRLLDLDLTIVIVRDDTYGFIAWHQDEQELPQSAVSLENPDLLALSQAFGATVARVASASELAEELGSSDAHRGLHVIECPIDYSINDMLDGSVDEAVERYERR